jgi:hypothetical protein
MIITFAKLQRLSGLTKSTAVKAWLKAEGVSYLRDKDGKPWTTLAAVNRRLAKAGDDGFTLDDPEGGLPEERPMVSGRQKPLDRTDASGRRAYRTSSGSAGRTHRATADHSSGSAGRVFGPSRTIAGDAT